MANGVNSEESFLTERKSTLINELRKYKINKIEQRPSAACGVYNGTQALNIKH